MSESGCKFTQKQQEYINTQPNIDSYIVNGFLAINKMDITPEQNAEFTEFMHNHPFKLEPEETIQCVHDDHVVIKGEFGDTRISSYKIVNKQKIKDGCDRRIKRDNPDRYTITMYNDGKEGNSVFHSDGLRFEFIISTSVFQFNEKDFDLNDINDYENQKVVNPSKFLQYRTALVNAIKKSTNKQVDIRSLPYYDTIYFNLWLKELSYKKGYILTINEDIYKLSF